MCKLISTAITYLTLITSLLASPFTFSDENELPQLTLLTENYGQFNYSLQERDFEHKEELIGGTSAEFVKKLMAETDISYRMKLRTWAVSYERALARPNYGVFSTARTEARESLFEWIGPIAKYELALFVEKDSGITINSLDDLYELRVGGYKGSAATTFLEGKGIEVSTLANDSLNPKQLHDDMIDVWVASDASAYTLANESGYPNIEKAFVIRTVDMYLAMNKESDPEILWKLRQAYRQLELESLAQL